MQQFILTLELSGAVFAPAVEACRWLPILVSHFFLWCALPHMTSLSVCKDKIEIGSPFWAIGGGITWTISLIVTDALVNCSSAPQTDVLIPQSFIATSSRLPLRYHSYPQPDTNTKVKTTQLPKLSPYSHWGGNIQIRDFVTLGGFRNVKLINGSNPLTKYLLQIPLKLTRKKNSHVTPEG